MDKQKETIEVLRVQVDELIEVSQQKHWTLKKTIVNILNEIVGLFPIELENLFIYTFDESLEKNLFSYKTESRSSSLVIVKALEMMAKNEHKEWLLRDDYYYLPFILDVAGEDFGFTCICVTDTPDASTTLFVSALITELNDIIDNYLQNIKNAIEKSKLLDRLIKALQGKVLEKSLEQAIQILNESIHFKTFILYFWDPSKGTDSLKYRVFSDGVLKYYSLVIKDKVRHELIVRQGLNLIEGKEADKLLTAFEMNKWERFDLSHGVTKEASSILLVDIDKNEFNIFNKDVIQHFCQFLLLRIMDFNKEYNLLSQYFCKKDVHTIIETNDYQNTVLYPKEKDIAILYSDIAGFTRISEQILKNPYEIGDFINSWMLNVCQIIWENHGVVDKFVGDCVIGLFGPPFFETGSEAVCKNAIQAAIEINQYTNSLNDHPKWRMIKESGLINKIGVSSGVNFAPTFVGRFGGDIDYTGFSSGMNNTARLQGLAKCDEIYVMEHIKGIVGDKADILFGERGEGQAKNVKEPLCYYNVLWE